MGCTDEPLIRQQQQQHKLCKWSEHWLMDFNVTKCYLMTITTKLKPNVSQYQMFSHPLTRVNSTKYLGITVDSRLNWSDHINNVTAKSRKTLSMTNRTLNPCTQQVKKITYTILV